MTETTYELIEHLFLRQSYTLKHQARYSQWLGLCATRFALHRKFGLHLRRRTNTDIHQQHPSGNS